MITKYTFDEDLQNITDASAAGIKSSKFAQKKKVNMQCNCKPVPKTTTVKLH